MPDIDQLITPEQQARNKALGTRIADAWAFQKIPSREMIIAVGNIDTDELIKLFSGKRFDELPFEGTLQAESPFSSMTDHAISYYVGGYMRNALNLALKADQNEWNGMGLEVIETIDALTKKFDFFEKLLSAEQKQCISEFLQFVRDHADFFCWEDKIDQLDVTIDKIGG